MEEKNFELEIAPLTEEELDAVDGGAGESRSAWRSARCVVKKNYLALRNHPSFKYENEIARISRGTVFSVKTDKVSGNYFEGKHPHLRVFSLWLFRVLISYFCCAYFPTLCYISR